MKLFQVLKAGGIRLKVEAVGLEGVKEPAEDSFHKGQKTPSNSALEAGKAGGSQGGKAGKRLGCRVGEQAGRPLHAHSWARPGKRALGRGSAQGGERGQTQDWRRTDPGVCPAQGVPARTSWAKGAHVAAPQVCRWESAFYTRK